MEYLERMLGIRVVYKNETPKGVPNYIRTRYRIQKALLGETEAFLLYPKTELEPASATKKHLERIEELGGAPGILVPKRLTYRQREYLLRERIPFVVDGKQIYLPFLALYLQQRCDAEKPSSAILPSAQLLLLCHIYHGCGELPASEATRRLGFTPTSISRASKQLEEMGLIQAEKKGTSKIIRSEKTPKELFEASQNAFSNPVKRRIYVPKADVEGDLLMSGYTALSEYTMLSPQPTEVFASESIAKWEAAASRELLSAQEQCTVELWRYDPRKLAEGKCVDRLSLALSLRGDKNERVEVEVENMLEQVWRDIDGQGN